MNNIKVKIGDKIRRLNALYSRICTIESIRDYDNGGYLFILKENRRSYSDKSRGILWELIPNKNKKKNIG